MTRQFTDAEKDLHKNKILIERSPYHNDDELVKYHLVVKNELLEHKCYADKCPTKKGNWKRKKMYLILQRNNGKQNDLRPKNLTLICPNCYCLDKGPTNFKEYKKKIEKKCKFCGYILNNKYKTDICYVCSQKLQNMDYSVSAEDHAKLTISSFDTSGNTSVAYINEYTTLISGEEVIPSSNTILTNNTTLDTEDINIIKTNKTKSKSIKVNTSIVDNIDINLSIELDDNLLLELDNL